MSEPRPWHRLFGLSWVDFFRGMPVTFAVSVRFPQGLARQVVLTLARQGVYEVRHFTGALRLIVVRELPQQEHNSTLHLFSARTDLLRYGAEHYRLRSSETSTLLLQLFERYRLEVALMPDQLEQLAQETMDEIVKRMSPEELRKRLSTKERLEGLSPEERLEGLSPEELLAALSPEKRAALAQRLKANGPPPNVSGQ